MANIHRIKLNEHQYKLYKKLLNENQEGDSINKAIKYREDFDIDNFMDDYEHFEYNCREYELYIAMDNIFY